MGAVYEAADERLGRQVAVKELLVEGEDLRRAFEREARLLANLSHASLPRVIDHFSEGGGQYLVMDYVPGEDLKHMMEGRRAPFPTAEVLLWADQLLEVLEYLHGHEPPVIHRDIKPSNLKLSGSRRIMLLDFGLAKGGQGTAATLSRSVFGYSPHFASLEQTQGEKSTPRSDLYSLSATLYYLLTAKVPPDALTRATAVFDEEADPLALVGELNPEVPERVAQVIMSGLELRTSARPASAAAMRSALRGEIPHQPAEVTDEVTRVAGRPLYSKVQPEDTSEVIGDGRVGATAEPPDGVSGRWAAGGSTAPSRSTYMKAAGLLLILAAVASGGYMWLASRAPGKPVTSTASAPPPNTELPQQFKPAAAALLGITLKDADGHVLAEGDGFFVTRDEAIVPLAAIEGASHASVTSGGEQPPRRVITVTRIDREKGLAVIKVEGSGTPLKVADVAPPAAGEIVKLLGIGDDRLIKLTEAKLSAVGKGMIEAHASDQNVGPGWLAVRESGEPLGLLMGRTGSGDLRLLPYSAVSDIMKKKPAPQPLEVAGAKDVLFDFRQTDEAVGPKPDPQEGKYVMDAVFGPNRVRPDDSYIGCGEDDRTKCLAADRAAGRVDPEILSMARGPFTQPRSGQTAYLIAAHETSAGHVDNFGTKRLAVFDAQKLVVNVDIDDYWEIIKTYDLDKDGTQELLLVGTYSQMGGTVSWAKLVNLRGGKVSVIKDFDRVYMDVCNTGISKLESFGALILYTPSAAGSFPAGFRQDVYRGGCGEKSAWKYLPNGKVPVL